MPEGASTRYLLDTNICIDIAKGLPWQCVRALSTIEQLMQVMPGCPVPLAAGKHYGQICATLKTQSLPIGNNDLWLAAYARAEGWILVTSNTREFSRVPGLQLENWTE